MDEKLEAKREEFVHLLLELRDKYKLNAQTHYACQLVIVHAFSIIEWCIEGAEKKRIEEEQASKSKGAV